MIKLKFFGKSKINSCYDVAMRFRDHSVSPLSGKNHSWFSNLMDVFCHNHEDVAGFHFLFVFDIWYL